MPILREGELDFMSHSADQTKRLGYRLGKLLSAGDVICLCGDMGAGKTVFSAGIGHGWGAKQSLTSPTYNLVHEHRHAQSKQTLYHLDCYRVRSVQDVEAIGFDDMLNGRNILIIEWAERIKPILPEKHLWLDLRVVETTRRNLIMNAYGDHYQSLVDALRNAVSGKLSSRR